VAPGVLPAGGYLLQLRSGARAAARVVTILR
jgi:hypothetical protein